MDVAPQIGFEISQRSHAGRVVSAAISGDREIAGQLSNPLERVERFPVLTLHHRDGVGDGSERTRPVGTNLTRKPGKLAHVREQDLLLLQEMSLEIALHLVEGLRDAHQLVMRITVGQLKGRELVCDDRQRGAHVAMVRLNDVLDETIEWPLTHFAIRRPKRPGGQVAGGCRLLSIGHTIPRLPTVRRV